MNIRFCHPSDFLVFLKLKSESSCNFIGKFGEITNSYLRPFLLRNNISCEMSGNSGYGDLIDTDGRYNGCLGRLQTNQSDVILHISDYPMNVVNLTQGNILFDTKMAFSQNYYHSAEYETLQILSSFFSGSRLVPYILLLFLCVLFLLKISVKLADNLKQSVRKLLLLRLVRTKKNHHHVQNLLAHSCRLGKLDGKLAHQRILFLVMSLFSLVVIQYILISIKTDLVVMVEPVKWRDYNDLIDNKVQPMFFRQLGVMRYFKDAPEGSAEKKLWNYSIKHFNISAMSINMDNKVLKQVGLRALTRTGTVILDETTADLVRNIACSFRIFKITHLVSRPEIAEDIAWRVRNFFYAVKSDPSSRVITKGILFNELFSSRAASLFKKYLRSAHELGLGKHTRRLLMSSDVVNALREVLESNGQDASEVRECENDSSNGQKKNENGPILLGNTMTLFLVYFLMNVLGIILFICEVYSFPPIQLKWKSLRSEPVKRRTMAQRTPLDATFHEEIARVSRRTRHRM